MERSDSDTISEQFFYWEVCVNKNTSTRITISSLLWIVGIITLIISSFVHLSFWGLVAGGIAICIAIPVEPDKMPEKTELNS